MIHNVVYLFSIYHGKVITPNLGNYQADMTIYGQLLTNQTLKIFSINIKIDKYINR